METLSGLGDRLQVRMRDLCCAGFGLEPIRERGVGWDAVGEGKLEVVAPGRADYNQEREREGGRHGYWPVDCVPFNPLIPSPPLLSHSSVNVYIFGCSLFLDVLFLSLHSDPVYFHFFPPDLSILPKT